MRNRTVAVLMATVAILALLWAGSSVIAGPPVQDPMGEPQPGAPGSPGLAGPVPVAILYQGRLWDDQAQQWVTGQRNITFSIYDDGSAGSQLWTETKANVLVRNGLFGVTLNVDQTLFNGQALWLEVQVQGDPDPLSPRTSLLPVPYALGLVPGATVQGETNTSILHVLNEGTNSGGLGFLDVASHGIHATSTVSGTAGVYGSSTGGYGVEGYSTNNVGVFGHSGWWFEYPPRPTGQHGVLGLSTSDHGVVGRTQSDNPNKAGVFGQSTTLTAEGVRGQGGTGVHGIGFTGVRGEGDVGVHGTGSGPGVLGEGAVGVRGEGSMVGVQGEGTQVGVYGSSDEYNAVAVQGRAVFGTGVKGEGETGVRGTSTVGVGVLGEGSIGVSGKSTVGYGVSGISEFANAAGVYAEGAGESSADLILGGTSDANDNGLLSSAPWLNNSDLVFHSNDEFHVYLDYNGDGSAEFRIYNGTEGPTRSMVFRVDEAGNMWAAGSKSGYVVDIVRNGGTEPLRPGDLVTVVGVEPPLAGQAPVIVVRRATTAYDTGVVGVVDQGYLPEKAAGVEQGDEAIAGFVPLSAEGAGVQPGDYLSVVTHGAFRYARVDAGYGAIRPGDLLVSSATPGHAMRATEAKPGTIVGKALGSLESGTGIIPVLVTLQ